MQQIRPKDLVAFLIIIGLIIFKLTGHNGSLDMALALIVGYYFARRDEPDHRAIDAVPSGT